MIAERAHDPYEWQERAACVSTDPELFFPGSGAEGKLQSKRALAVCEECPVKFLCRAQGDIDEGDTGRGYIHGVLGGETVVGRSNRRDRRRRSGVA